MADISEEISGTRFRIYPQSPDIDDALEPETVYVSSPAGSLEPGPSDERMYTVYPVGKQIHYGVHDNEEGDTFMFLPPWHAEVHPPAMPKIMEYRQQLTRMMSRLWNIGRMRHQIKTTLESGVCYDLSRHQLIPSGGYRSNFTSNPFYFYHQHPI